MATLLGVAGAQSQVFRGLVIAMSAGGDTMADAPAVKGPRLAPDKGRWTLFRAGAGSVHVAGKWLRDAPSADAQRIHALAEGTRIEATAGAADGGVIWWQVRLLDGDPTIAAGGWIRSDHVSFDAAPPA